jgi:hypothetical protein
MYKITRLQDDSVSVFYYVHQDDKRAKFELQFDTYKEASDFLFKLVLKRTN